MRALAAVLVVLASMASLPALAQESVFEEREFRSRAEERRYQRLIGELRCLVCQNQSIGASNAELAAQLRDEVYGMMRSGASDEEIVDFMVARYGDFVLFEPPMKTITWLLWFGPFALLLAGLGYLFIQIAKRSRAQDDPRLGEWERRRVADLMDTKE